MKRGLVLLTAELMASLSHPSFKCWAARTHGYVLVHISRCLCRRKVRITSHRPGRDGRNDVVGNPKATAQTSRQMSAGTQFTKWKGTCSSLEYIFKRKHTRSFLQCACLLTWGVGADGEQTEPCPETLRTLCLPRPAGQSAIASPLLFDEFLHQPRPPSAAPSPSIMKNIWPYS